MLWWETLHLLTWWKRLGISAIKTGQDAPSWIWCTERLSFFGGGHIVLQRFVHVRCHFQPLPTKLVFAYFDRGSCNLFRAKHTSIEWNTSQCFGMFWWYLLLSDPFGGWIIFGHTHILPPENAWPGKKCVEFWKPQPGEIIQFDKYVVKYVDTN